MLTLGFTYAKYGKTTTYTLLILVYVDDIIVVGDSTIAIDALIHSFNTIFLVKNLGSLNFFLGIQVHHRTKGGTYLSQTKYIHVLGAKSKYGACKTHVKSNGHWSEIDC